MSTAGRDDLVRLIRDLIREYDSVGDGYYVREKDWPKIGDAIIAAGWRAPIVKCKDDVHDWKAGDPADMSTPLGFWKCKRCGALRSFVG